MIYQKSQLSKIAIILWMVALSRAETCGTYTFKHTGEICAVGDTIASSITEACTNHPADFKTLLYCTEAVCSECNGVNNCHGNFSSTLFTTLTHTMTSTGAIFIDSVVTCNVIEEEYCYRSIDSADDNQNFINTYEISGISTNDTPLCCMVECDEKFTFRGQGCGFYDNEFTKIYNDESDFCVDYCGNRQITLISCDQDGCGAGQGCTTDAASCIASFNAATPVCGDDFQLYSTVEGYCDAKVAGTVSTFYTNYCDNGCNQANCTLIKCLVQDLTGYQGVGVCGDNGVFYFSNELYCAARYDGSGNVTNYLECNSEPCKTETSCCEKFCEINNTPFEATCGSNYTYYSNAASYCFANCDKPSGVTLLKIEGRNYTEAECATLRCKMLEFEHDVCYTDAYTVLTSEDYCDDKYLTPPQNFNDNKILLCSGPSGQFDCTKLECGILECESSFANGTTSVCGKDSATSFYHYLNALAYCIAEADNDALTSFVCDNVADCTTKETCCYQDCLSNNASYTKTCNTVFKIFDDKEAYCNAVCNNIAIAQKGSPTKVNFTEQECLFESCKVTYKVSCNESFELVSPTEYCNVISLGNTYSETVKNCDDENCLNCRWDKCIFTTRSLIDSGLCLSNVNFGTYFFASPADFCIAAVAKVTADNNDVNFSGDYDVGNDILCNGNTCNQGTCCDLYCHSINTDFKESCDNVSFELINAVEYCEDFCSPTPKHTNLDDCDTGCDSEDCTMIECVSKITLPANQTFVCSAGSSFLNFYFNDVNAYCTYLHTNSIEFKLEEQVSCEGQDCSTTDACCSVRCFEQEYFNSCEKGTYDFIDQVMFCNKRCGTRTDYEIEECKDPSDSSKTIDCTRSNCLKKQCLSTNSSEAEKEYCLETDDLKGEYFTSKDDFCATRTGNDSLNFKLDKIIACNSAPCDDIACCESVCANQSGFVKSCDPDDFSLNELSDYCSKWCADFTYTPLSCLGADCDASKCNKLKCMDALQSTFTAAVCLETELSGEYFHDNVSDYCDDFIIGSTTYSEPTTVKCAGDTICSSEINCYAARCAATATGYKTKCHPTQFTTLSLDEACRYKYSNAGDDSDLDECGDGISGCDNCKVFECLFDNTTYSVIHTAVCLDNLIGDAYFFETVKDYCEATIDAGNTTYTLGVNTYVECGASECEELSCCQTNCLGASLTGCKPDSFEYKNAEDYCDDFCDGDIYTPIICDSCTQTDCDKLNCEADLIAITGSICLATAIGNPEQTFFENISDYCQEAKSAAVTTYSLADYDCSSGSCADMSDCCERNCLTDTTFKQQCDATGQGLIDQADYCEYKCKSSSLIPRECYNPSDNVTVIACSTCAQPECEYEIENIYASQIVGGNLQVEGVCGNDNVSYDTIREFCRAKVAGNADLQMCFDIQGNVKVCETDSECCISNCLDDNIIFVPVCEDVTYDYISEAAAYCDIFCPDREFDSYQTGVDADKLERECAIQKCIELDTSFIDVCTTDTYLLVTEELNCVASVDDAPYTTRTCGSSACTQDDCDLQRCEFESLANYNFTKVCANDNILYETKALYCSAKAMSSSLETVTCSSGECSAKTCCESNCVAGFAAGAENFCNTAYVLYSDPETFCAASCDGTGVETLELLMCNGELCTKSECCNMDCVQTAQDVCDPTLLVDAQVPVDSSLYCENKCNSGETYTQNIKTCASDCTGDDCTKFKCIYDLLADYGLGIVCASDRRLYSNADSYCTAKYASNDSSNFTYTKCERAGEEIVCESSSACCEAACVDSFSSSYLPRCTSDYVWAATAGEYCSNVCGNQTLTDKMCTDADFNVNLCTQDQCCEEECLAATDYVPKCDSNYTFLDQADYCDLKCNDNHTDFKTCNGPCTDQTSCEEAKCNNLLSAYATENICLDSAVDGETFYDSLTTYCQFQAANDTNYTESNFLKCNNDFCDTTGECCNAKCNIELNYMDTCHPTTYAVLTQVQDCAYNCDLTNTPAATNKCMDATTQISCPNCKKFECVDGNSGHTGTICLETSLDDSYFFSDKYDYCDAMIAEGNTDYVLVNSDFICTDSSCDEAVECCILSCNADTSINAVCLISNYSLVLKNAFCTATCNGSMGTHLACGGDDCEASDCETFQCIAQTSSFDGKKICYSDADEANLDHINYYDNVDAYCTAKIVSPSDNYAITTEVLCPDPNSSGEGPCESENDCCKSYCLDNNDIYTASCNDNYDILDLDTYCTNFCNAGGSYDVRACNDGTNNIICDSCEIFKCLDDLNYVRDDPRKFCFSDDVSFSDYYASVTDLCIELIKTHPDQYTATSVELCDTTDGCESSTACCEAVCDSGSIEGACVSSNFTYMNKSGYCSNKCQATPTTVDTCGATGCSEDDCKTKKCEKIFEFYPTDMTVCLKIEFGNKNLYDTVNALCRAKAEADDTDYQQFDTIMCAGGIDCTDEDHCDEAVCLLNEQFNRCDPATFLTVDPASYCERIHIDKENVTFDECTVSNPADAGSEPDQVSCQTCTYFECLFNNSNRKHEDVVCTTNDSSYDSLEDFCEEREITTSLTAFSCDDGSCNNDDECCNDYCIFSNTTGYQSSCNNSDFVYNQTVADYCDSYCDNTRTYTIYDTDSEVCCVQKCITDGGASTTCRLDSYTSVDLLQQCEEHCADNTTRYKACANQPCDQFACDKLKCMDVVLNDYTFTKVCGTNNTLYATKDDFCIDQINDANLSFLNCENAECTTPDECCEANCLRTQFGDYTGKVCSSSYLIYDSPQQFCEASCKDNGFETLVLYLCKNDINEDVPCGETQCCVDDCKDDTYTGKCDDTFTYLEKDPYCVLKCNPLKNFEDCEGDVCNDQGDCDKANCLNSLSAYSTNGVCLNINLTDDYFRTLDDYCDFKIGGDKDYSDANIFQCSGNICDNDSACCNSLCQAKETLVAGCDDGYTLLTIETFCSDYKCGAKDVSTINTCEQGGSTVPCTSCDYLKCLDNNSSYTSLICLVGLVNSRYSFNDIQDYCESKTDENPGLADYIIDPTTIKCSGETCDTEKECCMEKCISDPANEDKCNNSYGLYTIAEQCVDICDENVTNSHSCAGGCDAKQCDIKNCEKINEAIATSICTTDAIAEINYFASVTAYCEAKYDDSQTEYAVTGQIICSDCSESVCCSNICQNKNLNVCDSTSHEIITLKDYCDDSCQSMPSLTVNKCYGEGDSNVQITCANCNIFKCEANYLASAGSLTNKLCLTNAVYDQFFFTDSDDYCDHLTTNSDADFTVGTATTCTDGTCDDETECCLHRCINNAKDSCTSSFELMTKGDYCNLHCSGNTPSGNDGCGDVDCTAQDCKKKECIAAWGFYTAAVCLETSYETFNFYSSVSDYCEAYKNETDDAFVISNPGYCAGEACDSETKCCKERCIQVNSYQLCDPGTYDVITRDGYCDQDCGSDIAEIKCNENSNQVDCNTTECNRLKCLKVFTEASYSGTELCLTDSYEQKYLYTVDEYCTAQSSESAKVSAVPTNQKCKDIAGTDETCADEADCCFASCISANPYDGCDSNGDIQTAEAICEDACTLTPTFDITYCTGRDCTTCGTIACLNANSTYTDESICLESMDETTYFFSSIDDFCDAKVLAGSTDYTVGTTILCVGITCADQSACCDARCENDAQLLTCNETTFALVTEDIRCAAFCPSENVIVYGPCLNNDLDTIDCTQDICNEQYACPAFFVGESFTGPFCFDNNGEYEHYPNAYKYCAENGATVPVAVPEIIECSDNHNYGCNNPLQCCVDVCLIYNTKTGCDSTFNLIVPNDYCFAKCSGLATPVLDYCGGSGCLSCELNKCNDAIASYTSSTVCLSTGLGMDSTIFFASKNQYCAAMIDISQDDYTLDADETVSCGDSECDSNTCCINSCKANQSSYYDSCDLDNGSLVTVDIYCSDDCGDQELTPEYCRDDSGDQISCTLALCCALSHEDYYGPMKICGNNGELYDNALEFCNAAISSSVTELTCLDECNLAECKEKYCNSNGGVTDVTFPACATNHTYYGTKSDFCSAYSTNTALDIVEHCNDSSCDEITCCNNGCSLILKPVIYLDGTTPVGYTNACLGICAEGAATVAYNCDEDVTVADCIKEYEITCGGECTEYNDSTDDYCIENVGYLNSATYCANYICSTGSNVNDAEKLVDCDFYDCSRGACPYSECLSLSKCPRTGPLVCGADGKLHESACHAQCADTGRIYDCPVTGDCASACLFTKCNSEYEDDTVVPVCASDGLVYDKANVAKCVGKTVSFTCASDCKGEIRDLRCKFDCQFNNE